MAWWREPGSRPRDIAPMGGGPPEGAGTYVPPSGGWSLPPAPGGYTPQPGGGYRPPPITRQQYTPLYGPAVQEPDYERMYGETPYGMRDVFAPPSELQRQQQMADALGRSLAEFNQWREGAADRVGEAGQAEYVPYPSAQPVLDEMEKARRAAEQTLQPAMPPWLASAVSVPYGLGAGTVETLKTFIPPTWENIKQDPRMGKPYAAVGEAAGYVGGGLITAADYPRQKYFEFPGRVARGLEAIPGPGAGPQAALEAFQRGYAEPEGAGQGAVWPTIGAQRLGVSAPLATAEETKRRAGEMAAQGKPFLEIEAEVGNPFVQLVASFIEPTMLIGLGANPRRMASSAEIARRLYFTAEKQTAAQMEKEMMRGKVFRVVSGPLEKIGGLIDPRIPSANADFMLHNTDQVARSILAAGTTPDEGLEMLRAFAQTVDNPAMADVLDPVLSMLPKSRGGKQAAIVLNRMMRDPATGVVDLNILDKIVKPAKSTEEAALALLTHEQDAIAPMYKVKAMPGGRFEETRFLERNPAIRFINASKRGFAMMVLGPNPGYNMRNYVNNLVTAVVDGNFAFETAAHMGARADRFGLIPQKASSGFAGASSMKFGEEMVGTHGLGRLTHVNALKRASLKGGLLPTAQGYEQMASAHVWTNATLKYYDRMWRPATKGGVIPAIPASLGLEPSMQRHVEAAATGMMNMKEWGQLNVEIAALARRGATDGWRDIDSEWAYMARQVSPGIVDEATDAARTSTNLEEYVSRLDSMAKQADDHVHQAMAQDTPFVPRADPAVDDVAELARVSATDAADLTAQIATDRIRREVARHRVGAFVMEELDESQAQMVRDVRYQQTYHRAEAYNQADQVTRDYRQKRIGYRQADAAKRPIWDGAHSAIERDFATLQRRMGPKAIPVVKLAAAEEHEIMHAVATIQQRDSIWAAYRAGEITYDGAKQAVHQLWRGHNDFTVNLYDGLWRELGGLPERGPAALLQAAPPNIPQLRQQLARTALDAGIPGARYNKVGDLIDNPHLMNAINKDLRGAGLPTVKRISDLDPAQIQTAIRGMEARVAKAEFARRARGEPLFQRPKKPPVGQADMFGQTSEDLPLFSGTPMGAPEPVFKPPEVGKQGMMGGFEPTFDELATAAMKKKLRGTVEEPPPGTLLQEAPLPVLSDDLRRHAMARHLTVPPGSLSANDWRRMADDLRARISEIETRIISSGIEKERGAIRAFAPGSNEWMEFMEQRRKLAIAGGKKLKPFGVRGAKAAQAEASKLSAMADEAEQVAATRPAVVQRAAPVPYEAYSAQLLRQDLQAFVQQGKITDKQATVYERLMQARARTWAKQSGLTEEQFYDTQLAGFFAADEAAIAKGGLLQRSRYESMAGDLNRARGLYQPAKGMTEFLKDGRAIVYAFDKADISTLVHEMAHVVRRDLPADDIAILETWTGVQGGVWTKSAEEVVARGWERYLAEGVAPTGALREVFERMKEWLVNVYRAIVGSDIDVNMTDEVRAQFGRWIDEGAPEAPPAPLAEARVAPPAVGAAVPPPAVAVPATAPPPPIVAPPAPASAPAPSAGARVSAAAEAAMDSAPPPRAAISAENAARSRLYLDDLAKRARAHATDVAGPLTPRQAAGLRRWMQGVRKEMNRLKLIAADVGVSERNHAILNYADQRVSDSLLNYGTIFHYWPSRTFPNWAKRALNNPYLLANYIRYKQMMEKKGQDLPEYYRRQWMVNVLSVPYYFDIERTLNPLYQLVYDYRDDLRMKGQPFGKALQDFQNMAMLGSPVPLLGYIHALNMYAQGNPEAARAWAGTLGPASQLIRTGSAWVRQQGIGENVIPPGGFMPEPWNWSGGRPFQGATPYEERRVGRTMYQLEQEGKVSREEALDALRAQQGPEYDQALQQAVGERAPGQMAGILLGQAFKGRLPYEVDIDRASDEWYSKVLPAAYPPTGQPQPTADQRSEIFNQFYTKYPWYTEVQIARKTGPDRDAAYARNVLSRIPPGNQRDAILKAAGIPEEMVTRFYDSDFDGWTPQDKDRFTAGILDMGHTYAIPGILTQQQWRDASQKNRAMWDKINQIDPQYSQHNREYAAIPADNYDAREAYRTQHPEMVQAWDYRRQAITSDPVLFAYYGGEKDIRSALEAEVYDEMDRRWPDARENIDTYYRLKESGGDYRSFSKQHPEMREANDWKRARLEEVDKMQLPPTLGVQPVPPARRPGEALSPTQEALGRLGAAAVPGAVVAAGPAAPTTMEGLRQQAIAGTAPGGLGFTPFQVNRYTPLRGPGTSRAWSYGGGGGGGYSYGRGILKRMSAALIRQLWLYFISGQPLESGALGELANLGILDYTRLAPLFAQGMPMTTAGSSANKTYWRTW